MVKINIITMKILTGIILIVLLYHNFFCHLVYILDVELMSVLGQLNWDTDVINTSGLLDHLHSNQEMTPPRRWQ